MAFSYNPQTFATMDITDPKQAKVFVQQLSRVLVEALSPQGIASLLNGSQLLSSTAVSSLSQVFPANTGATVGPLNVNAAFSESVLINQTTLVSPVTLTFTNVVPGSLMNVKFFNATVGNILFKIAASDTSGVPYTILCNTDSSTATGGLSTDMTTTGLTVNGASKSAMFSGVVMASSFILLSASI